jgi:uncharacterized protein
MKCPSCNIPLTIGEYQGVAIDFCSTCHCVWMERSALDKIIELSLLKISSRPHPVRPDDQRSQHPDKHYDYYYGSHLKKKGVMLH